MKTVFFSQWHQRTLSGLFVFGVLHLSVCTGLAAERSFKPLPASGTRPANPTLATLPPGTILITSPAEPATCSVAAANPRVESAAEGAGNAARSVLNTPHLGQPQLESCIGVLGFAASPFAAAYGALNSSRQRLSPDQLRDAQAELSQAMNSAARQENFSKLTFDSASDKTRRLLDYESPSGPPAERIGVSGVLETKVEDLQLRRAGTANDYRLLIHAHARLLNARSKAVILDRSYKYESGGAMFVDWTRNRAVQGVAETGYRELADRIAKEIFEPAADAPVFAGPADRLRPDKEFPSADPWDSAASLDRLSSVQKINFLQAEAGTLEVRPNRSDLSGFIQGMPSQPAAVAELPTDTEWSLGGLEDDRNSVVQAAACFAAVPRGLWEQTFGLVQQHSRDKAAKAANALNGVARQWHLQETLTRGVIHALRAASSAPSGFEGSTIRSSKGDLALEIRVLRTTLAGKPRLKAATTVCVETLATVYRASDHQELYVFPVHFRSSPRKLGDWAANHGQVFRHELQQCSIETAAAIADQMLARGFATPNHGSAPMAANQ